MIAELFTNNALNLVIIFGSCAALILMSFWFRRGNRKRKGFFIPCGAIFNLHHNYQCCW
ncbi:inner membrane protein [Escherichia coli]|nr:inner membrane protein [Escherichia coli]